METIWENHRDTARNRFVKDSPHAGRVMGRKSELTGTHMTGDTVIVDAMSPWLHSGKRGDSTHGPVNGHDLLFAVYTNENSEAKLTGNLIIILKDTAIPNDAK